MYIYINEARIYDLKRKYDWRVVGAYNNIFAALDAINKRAQDQQRDFNGWEEYRTRKIDLQPEKIPEEIPVVASLII